MNPDSNCSLCDKELRSFHRFYFNYDGTVDDACISVCDDCHWKIYSELARVRNECFRSLFSQAGRLAFIQRKKKDVELKDHSQQDIEDAANFFK
jgi:hypothetical protein